MSTPSPLVPLADATCTVPAPSASVADEMPAVPGTEEGQATAVPGHEIERAVMQKLRSHPSLNFVRLNVHQCNRNEIYLEGFLESNEDQIDLCEVVRGIHGITNVVNRVVTAQPVPKKG